MVLRSIHSILLGIVNATFVHIQPSEKWSQFSM
nr:MAG TPA: hypothetical protein [Caudoviricetes sp.]